MPTPELSNEEKDLMASLEPIIRNSVWSTSAKVFEGRDESAGKWIKYPLRVPGKKDMWGEYLRIELKPNDSAQDFLKCHCAFGTNQFYTGVAVYRILRELKRCGLLHVPGFDQANIRALA